jgi:hypothetical protein
VRRRGHKGREGIDEKQREERERESRSEKTLNR